MDIGVHTSQSVDYPMIAFELCEKVLNSRNAMGVLICGTGIGMSIAANKVSGIRAAACSDSYSASMSRKHNDSNVLCFGSRVVGSEVAIDMVDKWLSSKYESGRHSRRVGMIDNKNQL